MSAFLVDTQTIAIVAQAIVASDFSFERSTREVANELAAMNAESVAFRYREPADFEWVLAACENSEEQAPSSPERIATRARCLRYQSCETPAYSGSIVELWLDALLADCDWPTVEGEWR